MKSGHNSLKVQVTGLCFVFLSVIGFRNISAYSASWQASPPLGDARDQFTGGVIDGKIYVFGGNRYPDGYDLNSTEMLDPDVGGWVYVVPQPPEPPAVEELSGAVVNDKLYVFGSNKFNFFSEYDPDTNKWTLKTLIDNPRSGYVAVAYNNKIYVFGGQSTGLDPRPISDLVEAYDPVTDTWETVTHLPKNIYGSAIAVVGENAYVIGGCSDCLESDPVWSTDIYIYNFITHMWTIGFPPLPHPRGFSSSSTAPVVNGKIYLIGGMEWTSSQGIRISEKVDIYNTLSNTWQTGVPLPIPVDHNLSVVVNDTLYVIGGNTGTNGSGDGATAAVWKYSLNNPMVPFAIVPLLLSE